MVGLFSRPGSEVSRALLARFGCQDRADWLSQKRLAAWLKAAGYGGRTDPAALYQRLTSAPRGATGEQGTAAAQVTSALTAVLASLNTRLECRWQRDQLPEAIRELVLDDQRLRNDICWSVFDC
jgi:transposase